MAITGKWHGCHFKNYKNSDQIFGFQILNSFQKNLNFFRLDKQTSDKQITFFFLGDFHGYFRQWHFVPTTLVACMYKWEKKPNPFQGGFGQNHCSGYLTWTLTHQESLPSIVPLQYTWKYRNWTEIKLQKNGVLVAEKLFDEQFTAFKNVSVTKICWTVINSP